MIIHESLTVPASEASLAESCFDLLNHVGVAEQTVLLRQGVERPDPGAVPPDGAEQASGEAVLSVQGLHGDREVEGGSVGSSVASHSVVSFRSGFLFSYSVLLSQ